MKKITKISLIVWVLLLVFVLYLVIAFMMEVNNEKKEFEKLYWEHDNKIKITTSIIPIATITRTIWWDFVEVNNLVWVGVSPHGFDIKPNQMIKVADSDLVIYLWLEHIDGFIKKIKVKDYLNISYWMELLEWWEDEDEHDEEVHGWDEYEKDPHIWTSSENAILIATKIKNKLSEISPENKEYFETNLKKFSDELNKIKKDFLEDFSWKKQKEFIIFHDSYNYLFKELGIDDDKKLVFRKSVISEPDSEDMKRLIDEIENDWVNIAFKEPQFNDETFKRFTEKYNLEVNMLDPLWYNTWAGWYIEFYMDNLESLKVIYE